jgi:hypothetical protein
MQMSADRDKTQKFTFVYNNLYRIYRDEKAAASAAPPVAPAPQPAAPEAPEIRPFSPPEFIGKRIAVKAQRAEVAPPAFTPSPVEGLKTNLKVLGDIHNRLHFMLKELEELAADSDPETK